MLVFRSVAIFQFLAHRFKNTNINKEDTGHENTMNSLPYLQPEKLFFSSFDDKTLREISVKCITNPIALDRAGTPLQGMYVRNFILVGFNH